MPFPDHGAAARAGWLNLDDLGWPHVAGDGGSAHGLGFRPAFQLPADQQNVPVRHRLDVVVLLILCRRVIKIPNDRVSCTDSLNASTGTPSTERSTLVHAWPEYRVIGHQVCDHAGAGSAMICSNGRSVHIDQNAVA